MIILTSEDIEILAAEINQAEFNELLSFFSEMELKKLEIRVMHGENKEYVLWSIISKRNKNQLF